MTSNQSVVGYRFLTRRVFGSALLPAVVATGCGSSDEQITMTAQDLANRAYVVSEESNDLFVVDLATLAAVGSVDTTIADGPNANHMAMLSNDGSQVFVVAAEHDTVVVVDARTLEVTHRIAVGAHPTHAQACFGCFPDGRDELWVVNEDGGGPELETNGEGGQGSVTVIDMQTREVIRTIADASFNVPHFVRFSERRAYVPSIGGNQISVVDLDTRRVSDVLLLEGETEPGPCSKDPCGFADAQIDNRGLLVAAHIETGRMLSYDTLALERKPDLTMGNRPWSIFVDNLDDTFDTHLMPNWGDESVSVIHRAEHREVARSREGDQISYGVNYSPLAPGEAFVLNTVKERVAVIDRETGELIEALDVGGTTETASTNSDGSYLLLPISSTNQFVVLDMITHEEVARFDDVGVYPWSVTTIGGQNYCH